MGVRINMTPGTIDNTYGLRARKTAEAYLGPVSVVRAVEEWTLWQARRLSVATASIMREPGSGSKARPNRESSNTSQDRPC